MLNNCTVGNGKKIRNLTVILSLALALAAPFGCGGGGGGGESSITLAGIVFDPVSSVTEEPVGDVTVGLYRASDSTLIRSTITNSLTGAFSISIPINTEMYLKTSKGGYVSVNSRVGSLDQNIIDAWLLILPENNQMVVDLANIMSGESEPAWNSTLQSYGYVLMEATDNNDNDVAGFEISSSSPNMITIQYATNDAAQDYTTTPPTIFRTTAEGPMMVGSIDGTTQAAGRYAFAGTVSGGSLWETSIDAFLVQGEITFFVWDVL